MARRGYRLPKGAKSAGYKIADSAFQDIRLTIEKWIANTNAFSVRTRGDQVYYYNERATLSSLAGAFWQTGWMGIEEFTWQKHRKGTGYQKGRCDLWIAKGNSVGSRGSKSWFIEAKQSWPYAIAKKNTWQGRIERRVTEAIADARQAGWFYPQTRAYVVFVTPIVRLLKDDVSTVSSKLLAQFEECLKFCLANRKTLQWGVCAWCAPNEAKNSGDQGNYYPGVILLMGKA